MFKCILSLSLFFLFSACTKLPPKASADSFAKTTLMLHSLSKEVSLEEARLLAGEIYKESAKLRKKFQPVSSPYFNNLLINVGIKEQGLCYEWSDALYRHFVQQLYPHFEFHLLVSDKGRYFLEHNVLVITAKEGKVMDGVIVDLWRNSGEVYVSKVKEDKKYDWKWRKEREKKCYSQLKR